MATIRLIFKIALKPLCSSNRRVQERWLSMWVIWRMSKRLWRRSWRRNLLNWKEVKRDIEILSPLNLLLWKSMKDWSRNWLNYRKHMLISIGIWIIFKISWKLTTKSRKKSWERQRKLCRNLENSSNKTKYEHLRGRISWMVLNLKRNAWWLGAILERTRRRRLPMPSIIRSVRMKSRRMNHKSRDLENRYRMRTTMIVIFEAYMIHSYQCLSPFRQTYM